MRETELWRRLEAALGAGYARSWAAQVSLSALESMTVSEAIAARVPFKVIWEAAWENLSLPESDR